MKYILIALALFSTASFADQTPEPNNPSPYVEPNRFITTPMRGSAIDYIVTDTKTGCQYLISYMGNGETSQRLGCFQEYVKK